MPFFDWCGFRTCSVVNPAQMAGFCTSFQSTIHEAIELSIMTNLDIWVCFASCFMLYWIDQSLLIISMALDLDSNVYLLQASMF